jgi:transposase InsO family protein
MNSTQKQQFIKTLTKHTIVFNGKLGRYPHKKISIELIAGAKPIHRKPYSIPRRNVEVFKDELHNLIKDGVLEHSKLSEWGFPTFIIQKKDGRVRWVSDFRELNKLIKRKPHVMPKIYDIMLQRAGYKWFTKIDVSMQFYCFELDENSKQLCTIVTPFGKFKYKRLPMGVKISPDIAQSIMDDIFNNLDVEVYIDDIRFWSNGSFDDHLETVDEILRRLAINGMKCNPLKCAWAVKETDFLGYWMTPSGIKPKQDKIEAVLRMQPPKNIKQLRSFIGAVNFYKSMFPRQTHVLRPLTALTGIKKFQWEPIHQTAFEATKAMIAQDAINNYADINEPFHIYSDASDYQMGAVVTQLINNKRLIIAYWSRTLSPAQTNYNTMEKELLAIVMCVKEYRNLLYGGVIIVYTDHRNLTFRTLSTQRVIQWRMYLEDFDITFRYIEGEKNVLADCYSRLPRMDKPSKGRNENKGTTIDFNNIKIPEDTDDVFATEFPSIMNSICNNEHTEMIQCFLNQPIPEEMENPINLVTIQQHQFNDVTLNNNRNNEPNRFPTLFVGNENHPLICYRNNNEPEAKWRIAIPNTLTNNIIRWYHLVLGHPGTTRLYDTIRSRFYAPNLYRLCEQYQCPDHCQQHKKQGQKYGKLPPREVNLLPWNQVDIDLIGPWTIAINGVDFTFNALTCIDPVTNLVEIIRINNKTSQHVQMQFANCWLSRYPRPNRCVHDKGGEFTGIPFQTLLNTFGIKNVETTTKNPQANAICERLHQTVANILRTTLHTNPPNDLDNANQLVDNALSTCVHSTRCAVNSTLRNSPGSIVFQRDMLIDVPLIADLATIRDRRQMLVDENLRRQNSKRRDHHYAVGDLVMKFVENPNKMEPRIHGPYPILQVYTNGTVNIAIPPGYVERVNIRKITPYKGQQ